MDKLATIGISTYSQLDHLKQKELVQYIGHDGRGVHCGVNDKFQHDELWGKVDDFRIVKYTQVDERIRRASFKFRSLGLKGKTANFFRKIGMYPFVKKIKNLF